MRKRDINIKEYNLRSIYKVMNKEHNGILMIDGAKVSWLLNINLEEGKNLVIYSEM